jgi:hypothetical protein
MMSGQPAWTRALFCGVIAVSGYFALPGVLPKDVAYQMIGLASVAAMLVGVRRNRPADRNRANAAIVSIGGVLRCHGIS